MTFKKGKIAIIGLGYVGLPLAVQFGKIGPVIAFDTNSKRVEDLINHNDVTDELKNINTTTTNTLIVIIIIIKKNHKNSFFSCFFHFLDFLDFSSDFLVDPWVGIFGY